MKTKIKRVRAVLVLAGCTLASFSMAARADVTTPTPNYYVCAAQAYGSVVTLATSYTGGTAVFQGAAACALGADITSFVVYLDNVQPCPDLLMVSPQTVRLSFPCVAHNLAAGSTHTVSTTVCWTSVTPGCKESDFPLLISP